jgi:flagellar motility protein MotE (MotC chaperone)
MEQRMMRIRLLPFMILFGMAEMAVKLADLVDGSRAFSNALFVTHSLAEPSADKGEKGEGSKEDIVAAKVTTHAPTEAALPGCTPLSKTELELLQQLSLRRQKLEERESELSSQENILSMTQQKIDERLAQLKNLQQDVTDILQQYNDKEEDKIKSLVLIYEYMKPRDAAAIFETLDLPILLKVLSRMKQAKAALVLAAMSPNRAMLVTGALAEQRKLAPPPDCCGQQP